MKQIGIVLLLTVLAALGFVIQRVLDTPAPAPTVTPSQGLLAPTPRAPRPPPKVTINTPVPVEVDWKSSQSEAWIVPLAEAWDVDFDALDLEADVICTVAGVPITRDDYRRYVTLSEASPLVEARLTWGLAKAQAERHGGTIGISDSAFETMLEQWGAARGLDRDGAIYAMSVSARLSVPATRQFRRWSQEALLAYFQHTQSFGQLPPAMRTLLASTSAAQDLEPIFALLQETRGNLEDPETLRKLGGALDALAMFWGDVRRPESLRRTTTFLDDVLPAGAIATMYVGELGAAVEPPWLMPGEVSTANVEELWPLIGPHLGRVAAHTRLRELIWLRVLGAELKKSGHFAEPEAHWMAFWQEHQESAKGLMDLSFVQIMLNGFPTLHHYRAVQRVQQGFVAAQPEGWDAEPALREFADVNRFFVQRWNPQLEIALFPAQRPTQGSLRVDWEDSKSRADAMASAVAAGGDFGELRDTQQRALLEEYRLAAGEADAEAMRQQFQLGRLDLSVGDLSQRLAEQRFGLMVDCVSVVRSAVVELDVGEVSTPWRTRLGYALVRLNGAIVAGIEREFEDLEPSARQLHLDLSFARWANGVLAAAQVE